MSYFTAITLDDVIFVTKELSSCKIEVLKAFDELLNEGQVTAFDEKNEMFPWTYVMYIIIRWMRSGPLRGRRKGDLARKMLQLSTTAVPEQSKLKELSKLLFKKGKCAK